MLQAVEVGVVGVEGEELVVGSLFDDPTAVEDHDAVGASDGGESMGDDKDGAVFAEAFDGLDEESLGFGVEGAGGFIENQDRRIAQ